MNKQDRLIGRQYGQVGGRNLNGVRANPHYSLFKSVKEPSPNETLVLITDGGTINGHAEFIGLSKFQILAVMYIDYGNQTVRSRGGNYPIFVEPGKEIKL